MEGKGGSLQLHYIKSPGRHCALHQGGTLLYITVFYITVLYIRATGGRAGKIPGVPAQETVWSNWKISGEFVQIPDLANLKQAEGGIIVSCDNSCCLGQEVNVVTL